MPSFDLVSSMDMGEFKNVLNMAQKQVSGRYDFKGSKTAFTLKNDKEVELVAEDDYKMNAAMGILYDNMAKRKLGLKCLEVKDIENIGQQMLKRTIVLNSGINKENAKSINTLIKDSKFKVSSQYLDEKIRVTSKKIDDLQATFQMLNNSEEIKIDLTMENMK